MGSQAERPKGSSDMSDANAEPSPTGRFGERAGERAAGQGAAPDPSSRETAQHFFRRPKDESERTGTEGTAERPRTIDRGTPEG
jgi:hypothetical protein